MAFIPATCPSCGGNLQVPDDRDTVKCMYCGIDIILREQNEVQGAKIENYLNLARIAEQSKNHQEAYKYYSLVLEINPEQIEAWIGKGVAAGWESTLANPRVEETKTCFEKAMEMGLDDGELCSRAADAALNIASAFYNLARKHCKEFEQHSTKYASGIGDTLVRAANDYAHNRKMAVEFAQHTMEAVALIRVGWAMRPASAIARDTIIMCKAIVAQNIGESFSQMYGGIAKECEEWLRVNDSAWVRKQEAATVAALKAKTVKKWLWAALAVGILVWIVAVKCSNEAKEAARAEQEQVASEERAAKAAIKAERQAKKAAASDDTVQSQSTPVEEPMGQPPSQVDQGSPPSIANVTEGNQNAATVSQGPTSLGSETPTQPGSSSADTRTKDIIPSNASIFYQINDQVRLTQSEPLYFKQEIYRTGEKGEMFEVLKEDSGTKKVYLLSKDNAGNAIALNLDQSGLELVMGASESYINEISEAVEAKDLKKALLICEKASIELPKEQEFVMLQSKIGAVELANQRLFQARTLFTQEAAETARLRRNAEVADRPDPFNPNDNSGQVSAQQMRDQAARIEVGGKKDVEAAQQSVTEAQASLDSYVAEIRK